MKIQTPVLPSELPALVFCDEPAGELTIAGMSLLDRLVVALHRAGAVSITIVTPRLPSLKRASALGIPVRFVPNAPLRLARSLVASTGLFVQSDDIRALLQHGGRLSTADGVPLPMGVIPEGDVPWQQVLTTLPILPAQSVACAISNPADARSAEKTFWQSIKSSADGWVDQAFNRPCGRPLSKLLVHTPVSPNMVSLISVLIGLVAAWCFSLGSHQAAVFGALLFQLSAIVDCVDGDIARAACKESALGKWLDLVGDQVVHLSVFAGIAVGLARAGASGHALGLGTSTVIGALLSFAVVVRGLAQPSVQRNKLLEKLIDSATTRDFSVLVLLLSMVNRLEWFLWMAAIGSHLFWITALALQFSSKLTARRS